jgi:hypothetical protein
MLLKHEWRSNQITKLKSLCNRAEIRYGHNGFDRRRGELTLGLTQVILYNLNATHAVPAPRPSRHGGREEAGQA